MSIHCMSAYEQFAEMCSGFEAGSYLRLIVFVYHSTLGLRVIKKKKYEQFNSWYHMTKWVPRSSEIAHPLGPP